MVLCLSHTLTDAQDHVSVTSSRPPIAGAILKVASLAAARPSPDDVTLTIGIAASYRGRVDHNDVLVQVFFYDVIGGGSRVAISDLKASYNWLTKPPDWSTSAPEVIP